MWGKGKERGKTQKIKLVIESLCNGKKKNTAQPWSLLSSVEIPNNGNSSDNVGKIEFICIIAVFFFFLHAQFFTKIDFRFCPHPNPHTHTHTTDAYPNMPFLCNIKFSFFCRFWHKQRRGKNKRTRDGIRLLLLADTDGAAATTSGLGVLTTDTETPNRKQRRTNQRADGMDARTSGGGDRGERGSS